MPRSSHALCPRGTAAAIACAALLGACGSQSQRSSVLMVVVDTLRADRLGCYGADRATSPHIDALAARGVRFERTYSVAPWTMPSVATLLTGLHPIAHGVVAPTNMLPPEARTLAEILQENGWSTGSVVSNKLIGRDFGFDQGFELWDESQAVSTKTLSTPGVTDRACAMLDEFAAEAEPFFLFVHYFDPHYDYLPHPEYALAPPPAGRLDGTQGIETLRAVMAELSTDELGYVRGLYDEEIRFTDDGIGRLVAKLDELGLADSTVVVLTSDHGEEFVEHGWLGHTRSLYQEVVSIPLVVADPRGGRRGVSVPGAVSSVSVAATVLELAGVDAAKLALQGPSLAASIRGDAAVPQAPILIDVDFVSPVEEKYLKPTHKSALVRERFKLIRDERTKRNQLFDLDVDPREQKDLATDRAKLRQELVKELQRGLETAGAARLPELIRDFASGTLEALETMGYSSKRGE